MSDTRTNKSDYWICYWLALIAGQLFILGLSIGKDLERIADALSK